MLWLIAAILIAAGLYLIISGMREKIEFRPAEIKRKPEFEFEEFEEEFEEEPKVKKKVTGGGVVLIGPIPIVFGESRFAVLALILAIILMLISLGFMFMLPHA